MSIHMPIHMPIHMSIRMSVRMSVHMSTYMSKRLGKLPHTRSRTRADTRIPFTDLLDRCAAMQSQLQERAAEIESLDTSHREAKCLDHACRNARRSWHAAPVSSIGTDACLCTRLPTSLHIRLGMCLRTCLHACLHTCLHTCLLSTITNALYKLKQRTR